MPKRVSTPTPAQSEPDGERMSDTVQLDGGFDAREVVRRRWRRALSLTGWAIVVPLASRAKRLLDAALAVFFVIALSPLMLSLALGSWVTKGRAIERVPRVGRYMVEFKLLRFPFSRERRLGAALIKLGLDRLPVLWNIITGDVSFVGPRIVGWDEIDPREHAARKRMNARPGLLSLWWLRKRANVAFDGEWEIDGEYVDNRSLSGDIGIALRSVPALLMGHGVETAPETVCILGMRIHNLSMIEASEVIMDRMRGDCQSRVCFVNADCGNIAYRDLDYHRCVSTADLTLGDGIGLKIAGELLRRDLRENVNGTDLFPRLLSMMNKEKRSLYLLGARAEVVEGVARHVETRYPDVRVLGWTDGYFDAGDEPDVISKIAAAAPDCLLVAMGAPRQDMWIMCNLEATNARVAIGVGGLFDFYSGRVRRAPSWMREIGLEWVYRLVQEPGRLWRRYIIGNWLFVARVLRERLLGPPSRLRQTKEEERL